jgi:hypothetical protein
VLFVVFNSGHYEPDLRFEASIIFTGLGGKIHVNTNPGAAELPLTRFAEWLITADPAIALTPCAHLQNCPKRERGNA